MTVFGRFLSFSRACARTKKTGRSSPKRDLAQARVYSTFGAVNVVVFDLLPTAVFLLAPHVTSYVTGPSAILSIVIGAVAAILSGFSFLDLRCRVWKSTTSTQDALYRTGSEVSSFVAAWSSVARSLSLTAALVRGCSQSLNYLMGQRLTVLSLTLFGWVPSPKNHAVDILGFMVCMVVWALVALRLGLRPPRTVLVGFSLALVVVLGVLVGAAVIVFNGENWSGVETVFPGGYEGVMSGASIFYLSLTVFESLSASIEYTSPRSSTLHLRSSLLGVAILGLLLAASSSMISSVGSSRSNLTTEQPFSESFDVSGSPAWTKYLICVASMVFLAPGILVQFQRSVETIEDLARDGLIGKVLVPDDESQERSVVVCLVLGSLCALGCAALSIVTLCHLAAIGVLVEHLIVVVTLLTIRFQDVGIDLERLEDGGVEVTRDAKSGGSSPVMVSQLLPGYMRLREMEKEKSGGGRGDDDWHGDAEGEVRNVRDVCERVEEVAKEQEFGYKRLPENLKEELKDVTEEEDKDSPTERTNNVGEMLNTPSEIETPDGTPENSSSTTRDSLVSSDSVPSSSEIGEIEPNLTEQFTSKSDNTNRFENEIDSDNDTDIDAIVEEYLCSRKLHQFHPDPLSPTNLLQPTPTSYRKARFSILLYVISCLALAAILAHAHNALRAGHPVWIVALVLSTVGIVAGVVWLKQQPEGRGDCEEDGDTRLRVRNLALIYASAILINCVMLMTQPQVTSAVFGAWLALGLAIYVIVGVRRDRENASTERHLAADEQTSLLTTISSSVYREDKQRDRKSFIFGDDLFNDSSPVP